MKYEDVISDIVKLVGVQLSSIRPGSEITLTKIDVANGTLELRDSSNKRRSRPLAEVQKIWEQLCINKAVHVDTALGGSGSSRNQPETIVANLPYVEWLILGGKKHISFVGRNTHNLGSLKQMDPIAAQIIANDNQSANGAFPTAIIISDNLRSMANFLEALTGLPANGVSPGVYSFTHSSGETWVVNSSALADRLLCGVYLVIVTKTIPKQADEFLIAGHKFYLTTREGINVLMSEL